MRLFACISAKGPRSPSCCWRRWQVLCATGMFACMTTLSAAELTGTLVVANRGAGVGSVSLIDLETQAEIARLPIGPQVPHEVAVSPDGRYALTGEYGSGGDPGQRVVVIDIANARIDGYIDLGPDSRPHSFAFLSDGRAVATMESSDRIALLDVDNHAVLRTLPTGGRDGHMVRLEVMLRQAPEAVADFLQPQFDGPRITFQLAEAVFVGRKE